MSNTPAPELIIDFAEPIKMGGKTWESITLSEPRSKDMKAGAAAASAAPTHDAERAFANALIASNASRDGVKVPGEVIEELPISVFKQAAEYLGSFN